VGLVAWWPANGNAADIAGGYNGTLKNGATFGSGKGGQSFSFSGSAYVEVPDSGAWTFGTNDFTVELWANFAVSSGRLTFVASDNGNVGPANKWIFWLDNGNLIFHVNGSAAGGYHDLGVVPFTPLVGQWYYLAVTRVGSEFSFFTNGVLAKAVIDPVYVPGGGVPLTIGQAESGFNFAGRLDEISIYNRALSSEDIVAIYLSDSIGKCSVPTEPFGFETSTNGIRWTPTGVELRLNGITGQHVVVVLTSTNLSSWEPLYTNWPTIGSVQILDSSVTNYSTRFYRALMLP